MPDRRSPAPSPAKLRLKHRVARLLHRHAPRLHYELLLATRNRHIEPELWLVGQFCRRDRAAVDVGANEGLFSLYLAKHARRVHAFEPNPSCIARLQRLLPRRVVLRPVAASDTAGSADLRFDPTNTGIGTIAAENQLRANPGIRSIVATTVETATLDALINEPVSFIKIDVEGHEEAVLRGAQQLLTSWRPAVLVEVEERHNSGAVARVAAFMREHAYHGYFLEKGRWRRIEEFEPAMQELSRLQAGGSYVNNFLYVDAEITPRA